MEQPQFSKITTIPFTSTGKLQEPRKVRNSAKISGIKFLAPLPGNLETQVSQLAKQLTTRAPNTFPSDTEVNPKAECKAISVMMVEEAPTKKEVSRSKKRQQQSLSLGRNLLVGNPSHSRSSY
ncbi:hypothetical protein PIB30_070872 [Stylosanthes scabra]|uniref:Uncharacterized protein n=1 Tax=Stylosanthes scabra TaxID=79078 RepID=A0ABU6YL79_9FABA|nr:hypothetical protein [Stylosanthes scabra]